VWDKTRKGVVVNSERKCSRKKVPMLKKRAPWTVAGAIDTSCCSLSGCSEQFFCNDYFMELRLCLG